MSAQRILFVHSSDPSDNPGGGEASLTSLVSSLDPQLFDPVVAISGSGAFEDKLHAAGIRTQIVPMDPLYVTVSEISKLSKLRLVLKGHKSVRALKKLIKQEGSQLVVTNVHASHMYGAFAAKGAKVPHIMYMRDLPQGGFSTRMFPWLAARYASKVIAISESVADFFRQNEKHGEQCREKVKVVHNGIDTERLVPHSPPVSLPKELHIEGSSPVITLIGRLQEWKGQLDLIHASAEVVAKHPKAKVLLVGETFRFEAEYKDFLQSEVDKLGLSEHIHFTGQRKDIGDILAASDIAVSASWHEPFGRVIVEAMALGLPLVATRAGGAIDIVQDGKTGYLANPKDPKSLAEALLKLAGDPELAKQMGEAGRRRAVEKFDTKTMATNASEVLQSVLAHTHC